MPNPTTTHNPQHTPDTGQGLPHSPFSVFAEVVSMNQRLPAHGRHIGLALLLAGALFFLLAGLIVTPGQAASTTTTWRDVTPTGWIITLPVTVQVTVEDPTGLTPSTARYQTTQDGGLTWSDWLTRNITTSQPLTTTVIITVSNLSFPDAVDANRIRFRIETAAGTPVQSPEFTLPVDTAAPHVTITTPADNAVVEEIAIAGQASDATSGVSAVEIALQDSQGRYWNGTGWDATPTWLPADGTGTWAYTGALPTWTEGDYTVHARARDAAGNQGQAQPERATVDLSPPTPPQNLVITPTIWTNENAFRLSWQNPTDPAGIAGAWYKVGQPPTRPDDGTFVPGENITTLDNIQVPAEGTHTVYLWLQDGLGHADHTQAASVTARYDATPPGAPFALAASPTGWQRTNAFTLTWQNPTDLSGIAGVYYRFNGEPAHPTDGTFVPGENISRLENIQVPAEGEYDVYLWLVDRAGNVDHRTRNLLPRAFRYDATPPDLQAQIQGEPGTNDWYTSPVTITFVADDPLSGVDRVEYRVNGGSWTEGTQLLLDRDGTYTVEYRAVDIAGNWATPSPLTIAVDQTPPTLTYTITPEVDPSGWYRTPATIHIQAEDTGSGLDTVLYRIDEGPWETWTGEPIVVNKDGRHLIYLKATDKAGNALALDPVEVPVDRTAPITAYVVEGITGEDPWYVSPVTVTLTPTDTASGVVATYYRVDGGPWQEGTTFTIQMDGKHEIEFYSIDAAGWQEQGFPTPIWIDTTPPPAPPFVWVVPSGWTNRNNFRVEWATPSDLSQVVGAYYKLNEPPESPDDGTFVPSSHALVDITVPSEGAHTLYLWLRDGAGNADHTDPAVLEDALRYDITPPTTTVAITGTEGLDGWWRSPITLTFTVSDVLSGPDMTRVSVNGAPWQATDQLVIERDGKHTVRYYSVDRAGNVEGRQRVTVRVDMQPPPKAPEMTFVTQGWQHKNRFTVRWTPPLDFSGISGVRYTVGRPPTGPGDGEFATGVTSATLRAPAEGIFDVYVWLVDGAGNDDPNTAYHFPQAMWYDATPPSLDVSVQGTEGENGWFISPVTLRATATDTVSSGVTIWVELDDSAPITLTAPITLDREGVHRVRIWATDAAGNTSPVWEQEIKVDLTPPVARVRPLPPYMTSYIPLQGGDLVGFTVSWESNDGNGSGVIAYDVQVKEGLNGAWTLWQVQTTETTGLFIGQVGHTYFFRVRARDAAGHEYAYTTRPYGDTYTHLQVVRNGNFETGNFLFWQAARVPQRDEEGNPMGPGLMLNVKTATHYGGGHSQAAWLGDPEYGGAEDPGLVPIGAAVISQTVRVPPLTQMRHPTLEVWYHIITWDVMYSPWHKRWQDTFEIRILSPDGRELAHPLYDGYKVAEGKEKAEKGVDYGIEHDLGWRRFRYDLTAYAGQTIVIEISNWNRWDNKYNTYTIVDDVRIVDDALTPRQFLPLVAAPGATRAPQGGAAPQVKPTPTPARSVEAEPER